MSGTDNQTGRVKPDNTTFYSPCLPLKRFCRSGEPQKSLLTGNELKQIRVKMNISNVYKHLAKMGAPDNSYYVNLTGILLVGTGARQGS